MILVFGAFIVLTATGRSARERSELMERTMVGDSAQTVTNRLGLPPVRCPGDSLDHLRGSFSEDWNTASIDVALERLGEATAERWIYPLDQNGEPLCSGTEQRTEVGVAADGTVVWSVAVLGRTSLVLPPTLNPAGVQEVVEDTAVLEGVR